MNGYHGSSSSNGVAYNRHPPILPIAPNPNTNHHASPIKPQVAIAAKPLAPAPTNNPTSLPPGAHLVPIAVATMNHHVAPANIKPAKSTKPKGESKAATAAAAASVANNTSSNQTTNGTSVGQPVNDQIAQQFVAAAIKQQQQQQGFMQAAQPQLYQFLPIANMVRENVHNFG